MPRVVTLIIISLAGLNGCSQPTSDVAQQTTSAPSYEEQLRLQLETAKPGDVIVIPEGVHNFKRSLTLNTDNVTIRGAGMDKSVLSFKDQIAGAEGLLVNASDFTIEDVAIEDTKGDALKINEGKNIVIRRVRTEWTNGPSTENGSYGIYPVQTENTLIEGSVAIAASDAGIYVGQSRFVVVRNNLAEFNVAGIEIENTVHADVYKNVATNNTGGILVFNMPDLPQEGHSTRVFDNDIRDNNTPNFAPAGTAVAGVPAGSGILINSNDKVEIFANRIGNNQTANVLISSVFSAGYSERTFADAFDPYPETIYIYDNEFSPGGNAPDREELETLRIAAFGVDGRLPDIVWDGVTNPERDNPLGVICVDNGEALVVNVDAQNGYQNISTDMTNHRCTHEKLAEVSLTAR
ncbi:MAG: right-handed parallel beta-helix repeat-containing protein [Proteobacteria bacterium]|nr:right-handed parallel beta-helix repeat-containing protein [Pseudomonadota bacterium]